MPAHLLDRPLLRPTRHDVFSYGRKRLALPFRQGELEIWRQTHGCDDESNAELYVLKLGGTSARAERSGSHPVDYWPHIPTVTWALNPPGYGGSSGHAQLVNFGDAARTAFDAMARAAAGRPVLVTGSSLGATLALHVVARCPADGLIARNPPPLKQVILKRFGTWNLAARYLANHVPTELCSVTNAAGCHVPALFVTSGRDRIVPPACQQQVFDAYAGPKQRFHLEQAGHNATLTPLQRTHLEPLAKWLVCNVLRHAVEASPSFVHPGR